VLAIMLGAKKFTGFESVEVAVVTVRAVKNAVLGVMLPIGSGLPHWRPWRVVASMLVPMIDP